MAAGCPSCGGENPPGKRFCAHCGARLSLSCPSCGAAVAADQRFCGDCGAPLSERAVGERAPLDARPVGEPAAQPARVAERRVTSVLFGDLISFTSLSELRDPEEVRELLSAYFDTARTVVTRYGGTIEKFIGDAVMAVWGVPTAHEDDAERAVRAGMDLVAAVSALGEQVNAPELDMRVGVVTGEVAVTLGAVGEGMVAGDAVNTVARVQAAAGAGMVLVDEGTRQRTAAAVSYSDAGEHRLKGKVEPVRLFAARAVVASVGGAQRVDGLEAPFTGRDRELRLVKELFHAAAEERRPRLVAVFGVAGIGKSRLAWEFEKYADGISAVARWHKARCLSYGDGVAFWPLAEMVRSRLRLTDADPPSVVSDRLGAELERLVADTREREWLRPRLGTLLGLEPGSGDGVAIGREDLFAAWTSFLERVSGGDHCVVLVLEDMQHADAGLLDFIDQLMETARFPLFVLTLARPELVERRPGWGSGRRATSIYLDPLPDQAMGQVVDGLVDGLPATARATLVARADGIPLYAVETVRALIDRDAVVPLEGRYVLAPDAVERVDLTTLGAPASLHALIAARLDALTPAERQVVQDAAVHGLAFARDGLAATSTVRDLDSVLGSLVRKEILAVHADRFSPELGQYRFVQALVRQVAYETLSRRDRKSRHLAVAAYLAADAGASDELAAVLARHHLDALDCGPTDPDADSLRATALDLLERAAQRAERMGSTGEALRHYESALSRSPDLAARARLSEGAARMAQLAARHDQAAQHAQAARGNYEQLGQPVDAARVVALLGRALSDLGRLQEAIDVMAPAYESVAGNPDAAEAALHLTEALSRAHFASSSNSVAQDFADRGLRLAEAHGDRARTVGLLTRFGVSWITQGVPTGGMALLRAAAELAREQHLPHAKILPLLNIAAFANTRDLDRAQAAAAEALETCAQVGARNLASHSAANLAVGRWLAGDWDGVVDLYTEYDVPSESLGPQLTMRWLQIAVLDARGERSQVLDGDALPELEDRQAGCYAATIASIVARHAGRLEEAARLSSQAIDAAVELFGIDDDFALIWPFALENTLAVGDLREAHRLVALVDDAPSGLVTPYLHAQLLRQRGLVAAADGQLAAAEKDLAAAADELRAFGAKFYLGRALLERADVLAGDTQGGLSGPLVEEARSLFVELQAKPWVAKTERMHPLSAASGHERADVFDESARDYGVAASSALAAVREHER